MPRTSLATAKGGIRAREKVRYVTVTDGSLQGRLQWRLRNEVLTDLAPPFRIGGSWLSLFMQTESRLHLSRTKQSGAHSRPVSSRILETGGGEPSEIGLLVCQVLYGLCLRV